MTTTYARALYDFQQEGPNLLPLREGDLVLVTEQRDDGWWGGVLAGTERAGFFPANYVEIVPDANTYPQSLQQQPYANNTTQPIQTVPGNTNTNYGPMITAGVAGATGM